MKCRNLYSYVVVIILSKLYLWSDNKLIAMEHVVTYCCYSHYLIHIIICNCNLFAFRKSRLGYNPVDIEIVTYILYNTIYAVLGES